MGRLRVLGGSYRGWRGGLGALSGWGGIWGFSGGLGRSYRDRRGGLWGFYRGWKEMIGVLGGVLEGLGGGRIGAGWGQQGL